ncbi:MAG: protein-glutamine gamma-glutamyltransferase [Actinomycetota bacterium]|jgi:transglutaminase-like putative cysteine protease|nr:protein-glutamine gamma-glutamyltransferase [Actinomycetota bacterium]
MRELRWAGLVAGILGQVAAAVAGVLPWPLLPVVAILYAGGVLLVERATEERARLLNRIATAAALALAVLTVPRLSSDRDTLRTTLGLLLVLIQVVHGLTWRTRRDVEIALGMAAALLVLGASFAPDVLVGLPLLAGWAAVVAGVVLCVDRRTAEAADAGVAGGRRTPLVAVTSASLVLGLAAFLLVPVPDTPARRSSFVSFASGTGPGRGAATYSATRLDMRMRGVLSDKPVLEVPSDSAPLWRSQVFGFYGGLTWSAASGQLQAVPGPPWKVGASTGATRSDRAVRRSDGDDGATWLPAEPVQLDADEGSVITDGDGTVRSAGLRSYTVVSSPQEADPDVLRGATGRGDNPFWLQLPAALPDRVRGLSAELVSAAPTRYDAVVAVETWLRTHATYTLDSPVPARGEDAVDRFLFVDRIGFCEQFAAAETVLLRAAGIPARLATGLAAGVPGSNGRRVFRERDLHAWVEVFYPGVGWSPSDPTAGVQLAGGGGGSSRVRLATAVNKLIRTAQSVPGGRVGLAGLLVLAAVGIAALARLYRPRRHDDDPATERAPGPVTGPALAAFLRFDGRLGADRRRPQESLAELAGRLEQAPRRALSVVETECYGATPPPDALQAAAVLDGWQRAPT